MSTLPDSVLTDDALARIAAPIENGSALPNACYTSQAWLQSENERLFSTRWMLAGFCHDIPEPGDACPVKVAGMPPVVATRRQP